MFHLYHGNRLEDLLDRLLEITAEPLADPFLPETIIVQNPGMARWTMQQIAQRRGIGFNFEFPLPARFIHQIFASQLNKLPEGAEFSRDVLLWRIFFLLPEVVAQPGFEELDRYLNGDKERRKAYQLAGKISDVFDQYLVYRPEMIAAWEDGKESHWQARIWRLLTSRGEYHRGRLFRDFFILQKNEQLSAHGLPQRIFLFGVGTLAPVYLQVLQAISQVIDVHLFFLNPCREYWGDLLSQRARAEMRARWRRLGREDISRYYSVGNPLLSSLGVQGREFFEQLAGLELVEESLFQRKKPHNLLTTVQSDILELVQRKVSEDNVSFQAENDRSIQFHICHSRTREVQVLHDRLLEMFETIPDLTPRDIIVMAPNMGEYGSAITGVFSAVEKSHSIPWSLADRSADDDQPIIRAFLALLEMVTGRYTLSDVLGLLEIPAVLHCFHLDDEALGRLRIWMFESGIRWGLNSAHRLEFGLDDSSLHTWEFGLNRLLLGYCMESGGMYHDIVPFSATSGSDAEWIGELACCVDRLGSWRKRLTCSRKADDWRELLLALLDDFFLVQPGSEDEDALGLLRETIVGFADHVKQAAGADAPGEISLPVVVHHFKGVLKKPAAGYAFLSGRVTFCNMVPMRAIPFRVICLLGMNDTDYPRVQQQPSFDLIGQEPRSGDRRRRDDDCYLFLEALLSARDIFYISWVGRDIRDNSKRMASVVVSELRDYLDSAFEAGDTRPSATITTLYPLQPFSHRCFDGQTGFRSYCSQWLPSPVSAGQTAVPVFMEKPLPEVEISRSISINALIRFWNHPVRFFLRERLGLKLHISENVPSESEPFALDNLKRYQLGEETLDNQLAGEDTNLQQRFRARGELPHKGFGQAVFQEIDAGTAEMAKTLEPILSNPQEPLECRVQLGDWIIGGVLGNLFSGGRICFRPAKVKAKDLLSLWIHHLILNLEAPVDIQPVSIHVGTDKLIRLQSVIAPAAELLRLVEYFRQGLCQPLHFYPQTSLAWAEAKPERRGKAASLAWHGGYYHRGEKEDIEYRLALSGIEPLDETFQELAEILYPLLDHMENSSG